MIVRYKEFTQEGCEKRLLEIGNYLKQLRKKYNVSQDSLAQISGVSKSTINNVENAKHCPTLVTFSNIAKAFGFGLMDFLACGNLYTDDRDRLKQPKQKDAYLTCRKY